MLKINKILSKKIKSPLSLQGLFTFCHSRESGNPSHLSLRGAKRRSNLNHNGFSLIELMIAVVILALAVFGIFHAYSAGFMGMADARDRTVATNIAQEKMEGIKNIPFLNIDDYRTNNNGTTEISGKVFTINIKQVVKYEEEDDDNLKKVTTEISWFDRNGNLKKVVTETLIYNNDL